MFTRVVQVRAKTGKARDLSTAVNEKVLPILKKQPGFVDEITLLSTTEPESILALSFWDSESDAEQYQREQFPNVTQIISQFLENPPRVQTFNVDIFTTHNIA